MHEKGTSEQYLVATPREHRQRHWDRHVDSKLANIDLRLELASSSTGLCEDSCTITVAVLVDDFESFIQSFGLKNNQNRAKDLLAGKDGVRMDIKLLKNHSLIAPHAHSSFDDGRPNKVAFWVTRNRDITAVEDNLAAVLLC